MNLVVLVGITKRPGCRGVISGVRDITLQFSEDRMSPRWPLAHTPRSLYTNFRICFNYGNIVDKDSNARSPWILLVWVTPNGISGS